MLVCEDSDLCGLNRLRGSTNHIQHEVGFREHGDVAAFELMSGSFHALRKKTFQIRVDGAVVLADDIPARLRLPCGSPNFRLEQVGFRDALGRPNELLLLLRKVSAEKLRALGTQPDSSIHDFDVGEDFGPRELGLLRLRRFISVRSERTDVNQPDDAFVDSGAGDDASAVGVADEDNGAADPAYRCSHQGDVLCCCVEAVLRCNTLITLCLKWNDQLAEARTIRPKSVCEYNTWFCFHINL